MNMRDREVAAVCTRIQRLAHTLDHRECEELITELDSTLSQFEEDSGNIVLKAGDSQLRELIETLGETSQFETNDVPEKVNNDIEAMKDIVDEMSDSE